MMIADWCESEEKNNNESELVEWLANSVSDLMYNIHYSNFEPKKKEESLTKLFKFLWSEKSLKDKYKKFLELWVEYKMSEVEEDSDEKKDKDDKKTELLDNLFV